MSSILTRDDAWLRGAAERQLRAQFHFKPDEPVSPTLMAAYAVGFIDGVTASEATGMAEDGAVH